MMQLMLPMRYTLYTVSNKQHYLRKLHYILNTNWALQIEQQILGTISWKNDNVYGHESFTKDGVQK